MIRRFSTFVRSWYPLLAIGAATLWASVTILINRVEEAPPGITVIRLGHWQLEAGVRDAINAMAEDYAKLHPNVRIVQDAIPDQVFAQWANTQLLGGTAPDLIEAGGMMSPPLWLNLQRRYLMPLTEVYGKPNPYNKGTDLEGVPLVQTFKAGTAVIPELQENMDISLSRLSIRVFYNKDLLKQLTGVETPPQDLQAFLSLCRDIQSKNITPIVGSSYHFGMWNQVFDALTYPATREADFNRDGYVGNDEMFVGFEKGLIDFNFPAYRAKFQLIREMSQFFQTGFTGLTREEGVLLFAQKKAVFMSTGLWEAQGIVELAAGKFEVGVMKFPEPAANDPVYGRYLEGPIYEEPRNSLGFSVSRASKNPEIALDFLLFMASQKQDQKLNQIIGWIPNVIGAKAEPALAVFEPNISGVYPAMDFNLSGDTMIRFKQDSDLYMVDQISYDDLARDFTTFYNERGAVGFADARKNWQRGQFQAEQLRAGLRADALLASPAESDHLWNKYCILTSAGQIGSILDQTFLIKVSEGVTPPPAAGGSYSPELIEKIRRRLLP